jgi:type I restriction enzyme S subunit
MAAKSKQMTEDLGADASLSNLFEIPSGWTWNTLGDVAAFVNGDRSANYPKQADFVSGGVAFVNTGHIEPTGRLSRDRMDYISRECFERLRSGKLAKGDIVYCLRGSTIGKTARVDLSEGSVASSLVIIRAKPNVSQDYLYYFLVGPLGQSFVRQHDNGSAQPNLSVSAISRYPIPMPPPTEQKAIAAVLGALDDKVELNRRMNATMQAMARSLFQSWFVDFDPVRAKLDARKPAGLDPTTADLFAAAFEDSEAVQIPKGWTVGKVGDIATLNRGTVNPGDFPTETFDHFSLPAFDNGRTPKIELGSAIMSNKFTVTPNSVLLSKLNPHIPRIWLPDLHASRRSVCSTEFMVACPKSGVSREYLYSLFTSPAFASIYGMLVTGTTGSHQRIRPESVLEMKIVIPPAGLISAFTDIVKPIFDRINRNTDQSNILATLRDTLLPKLLSGELSVPDTVTPIETNRVAS